VVAGSIGSDLRMDYTAVGDTTNARWSWAGPLRRVFAIEILVCARCGGPRRILGAVTEPHAVRRLLAALGLAAESPPRPVVPAA
jgi:hypothetical protein